MKLPSVITSLVDLLVRPAMPPRALSISESSLVFVTLRNRRGEYESTQAGVVSLPPGLVQAGFDQPNIKDEGQFHECLQQLADQAGVRRMGRLSVSLPAGSAKTFVVALDSVPASKAETAQLVDWKIERATGYQLDELRICRSALSDQMGSPHWLIGVVHRTVLAQFETAFARVGWQAGLITPRAMGELSWLLRDDSGGDRLLVSVNSRGFELIIVRRGEPVLVRDVECAPEEVENEFYRLMVYYRERLVPGGDSPRLEGILTVSSPAEQHFFRDLASAALEQPVVSLSAGQIGIKLDPGYTFPQIAAAAGLASLAG